jgi:ATP-dependent helicase/nuclease subunit A
MTVHGAKGLEAPVVVLADATADPARLGRTPLSVDVEIDSEGAVPLLRPKKDEHCPPFDKMILDEEKRNLEEHMRLLYVALTRSADRLIVSGVRPKERKDGADPRPRNCWHGIVERAMTAMDAAPGEAHVELLYGLEGGGHPAARRPKVELAPIGVPDWTRTPAPPEARPPRPLAPSAIASDDEVSLQPSVAMRAAALRGTWIHQLLERLPTVEESNRPSLAERWLERSAGVADEAVRKDIVAQVCSILSEPRFARLFGPGSLGEAPLAATLPDGRVIAGTVDRLLVEEECVSVIDFKTGKVPSHEVDIPNAHRAQMGAYAEALAIIFPGRQVRASLLYTAGPRLFEVTP